MDNYFSSIGLFKDLALQWTYATGTIRSNRVGLPSNLKNLKLWKRSEHGHLEWAMHENRGISYVMWKDKCLVLLISSQPMPVGFPCVPHDEVPWRNGATQDFIPTSPMLCEYTTYMWGVDVADQLRASYSSQTWSHKWRHQIFWFLIDMTEVNMYISTWAGQQKDRIQFLNLWPTYSSRQHWWRHYYLGGNAVWM
jgi:hypothetical protein